MNHHKLDSDGITHYVVLIAVVSVISVGGVFAAVLHAHDKSSTKSNQSTAISNHKTNGLTSSTGSQSKLTPATSTPASTSNSVSAPKSTASRASSTAPSRVSSSSSNQTSTSSAQSTSTTASQTPLGVLTALIADLDNGAQVNITASAVTVPGPISNAQARPMVFTANGQLYFAYRQESAPNFTTSASQTAGTMAIVNATVSNPSLVQAHLDKAANLVDPNISNYLVAYSQGGN